MSYNPTPLKKRVAAFGLSTLFIGVSRKKINDYRVSCENPAGTKSFFDQLLFINKDPEGPVS